MMGGRVRSDGGWPKSGNGREPDDGVGDVTGGAELMEEGRSDGEWGMWRLQ